MGRTVHDGPHGGAVRRALIVAGALLAVMAVTSCQVGPFGNDEPAAADQVAPPTADGSDEPSEPSDPDVVYPPPAWVPTPGTTWQWQLQGTIDTSVSAAVFDVDLFDVPTTTVQALHAAGKHTICYLSAGTAENWRADYTKYPAVVLGNPVAGLAGERWVDIRRLDLLGPILRARLDLCRSKRFEAVEPDNVDAYTNGSGFPLTGSDQLTFNRWLANEAHKRGLAIGLKNDVGQVPALVAKFDFAVNESCFAYNECRLLKPFTDAGKAVLHVEYAGSLATFCPVTTALGFSSMKKRVSLDAWRSPCP
jgi:hypothetical protein